MSPAVASVDSINLQFVDDRPLIAHHGIGAPMIGVTVRFYSNGSPRIDLVDAETGEPWATATVNVPDLSLPDGLVVIKEWSGNEGMGDLLVRNGILMPGPVCAVPAGHTEASAYALTDAMVLVVDHARENAFSSRPRARAR